MSLSSLKGNLISYDTETTGLNPWNSSVYKVHGMFPARPFAFAFGDAFGNSAYIRWEVDPRTRQVQPVKRDIQEMGEILGDPGIVKVGHNLDFDIRMSRLSKIRFDWTKIHDTAILAHVLMGGVSPVFNFRLKPLASYLLDVPKDDEEELLASVKRARIEAKEKGWKIAVKETHGDEYIKSDYWLGDPALCKKYALCDVLDRTMGLYLGFREKLKENPKLAALYRQGEIPLIRSVYRMEKIGIRNYPERSSELRKFYADYVAEWQAKADKLGGKGVNFNSPKQLVKVFCTDLKHVTKRKTDSGQPSIDADELLRMSSKFPLAKAVLECKAGQSMISKFLNSYDRLRTAEKVSLIHPSFHQTGARTGRFSCSDPNFQQLASPDSVKKKADIPLRPREVFGPRDGNFWIMADYSQMEVWDFAFSAKDPILMKALLAGEDVHERVGKMMWGKMKDWKPGKTPYRKKGKTIMFLKQYGGGAPAYVEFVGCTKSEAYYDLDMFNEIFPGVDEYIEKITEQVKDQGFIENPFGRQSYIDRSMAYTGVNYLIQGTCADIMKRAMVRLDRMYARRYDNHPKTVLTVHDELAIEANKKYKKSQLANDIVRVMQMDSAMIGLPVPLPVSVKFTETTWAEAKEVKL